MKRNVALWMVALAALALTGLSGCKKSDPAPADEQTVAEPGTEKPGPQGSATEKPPAEATAGDEGTAETDGAKSYGAPLGDSPEIPLDDVLAAPETYADQSIRTAGLVRQACTKKGCWMEVAVADADDAAATRVTFKDYGFFVPTDSAGSQARLEGKVVIKTVAAEDVEHLEAEGAKFVAKADDGSAKEVQFVASGVELVR